MNQEDNKRLALDIKEAQQKIDSAIGCMSTNEGCDEHPTPDKKHYPNDGDPHEHPPCDWCYGVLEEAYQLLYRIRTYLEADHNSAQSYVCGPTLMNYKRLDPNKPAPDLADEFPKGTF